MKMYTLQHITDLALLDEQDIDAFCAEMPNMIRNLKDTKAALEMIATEPLDLPVVLPNINWQNDGLDEVSISVKV